MANDYAPRQFLRHVQTTLLREYFAGRGTPNGLNWDGLNGDVEPIYEAWQGMPEHVAKEVERDFRRVHAMGTSDGTRAIVDEGHFHGMELIGELDALDGHPNKALWTLLRHPRVFDVAELLHRADLLNGRFWRKRKDIPKKDPDVTPEALKALAESVAAYFRERQGRGSPCQAETYLRGARYYYFFVYPKDYTDTFVGYDDAGRFERRPVSPAFEVIYVYDSEDAAIELYVHGDKNDVRALQELFARTILHEELGEEAPDAVPYDLSGLKARDFSFPTDPADGIIEVRVSALKLSLVGSPKKRITFEASDAHDGKDAVYDLMRTALDERRLPLSMVDVRSAVVKMVFDNANGRGRATRTLTFRVSYPDSCNLKDSPDELLAKKYLKAWKIERA